METLQQKRVVIQAVKTAILLLFILGFDFSYCQTIDGQYRSCDPSGQSCQSIEFKKNKFHSVYAGDFGPKVISKGYFIMLKDTLLLFHDNPKDDRKMTIEKTEKKTDSFGKSYATSILLEVVDNNENKLPGVNILLRSKDNKILKGLTTNDQGATEITLSCFTEVDNVLCSWLTDELQISVYNFIGYSSSVKVRLSTNNTKNSTYGGWQKYLVKEQNKKILQLQDIDTGSILMYSKVK